MVYGSTAFYWDGSRCKKCICSGNGHNTKDKAQQDEIDRKVEEYRKRQEKDSSEIKR